MLCIHFIQYIFSQQQQQKQERTVGARPNFKLSNTCAAQICLYSFIFRKCCYDKKCRSSRDTSKLVDVAAGKVKVLKTQQERRSLIIHFPFSTSLLFIRYGSTGTMRLSLHLLFRSVLIACSFVFCSAVWLVLIACSLLFCSAAVWPYVAWMLSLGLNFVHEDCLESF